MHFVAPAAVVAAAFVAGTQAQAQGAGPTVTTPTSLVECQPAQFTVSGGQAPYFLSIIPGGQAGSAPLESLPDVAQPGSVTWNVDIQAGQSITVQVRDSAGSLNYSQQVTIQPGTSNSCVGQNGGASAGGSSASASAAGGASSAASSAAASATGAASSARSQASSVAGSASSAARSAASSAAGSPAASSPAAPSGGSSASSPSASASGSSDATKVAATGVLGLAGVVFAALFA